MIYAFYINKCYVNIAGLFSAFGIPLMGLAMGNLTSLLIKFGDPEKTKKIIKQKVTKAEIEMMTKYGIDDGDGQIDFAEYTLLCCVRLGAMNPGLIDEINKRFATLNVNGNGKLTREELLQEKRRGSVILLHSRAPPRTSAANLLLTSAKPSKIRTFSESAVDS
jgi:hypothetical protein